MIEGSTDRWPGAEGGSLAKHWTLDPGVTYLNHGSFGACPVPVLKAQTKLRRRLESQPMRFFLREAPELLERARAVVADFLGADTGNLVFVTNATAGVNTVLASLTLRPGDELLLTDHEYASCAKAAREIAGRTGARVVVAKVPFPLDTPDRVLEAVLARVSSRTAFALIDHVTSPTGLVLPIHRLVAELEGRGVPVMVDGAHAPGMVPLDIEGLGASYYTANCHKWLCAPKGAAILWAREDRRQGLRPLSITHCGAPAGAPPSAFQLAFDWPGTHDPTPWLCVPESIRFMGSLLPGGWPELMERNRDLALEARRIICRALEVPLPCPDEMIGSLATIPVWQRLPETEGMEPYPEPLWDALVEEYAIEAPVVPWPALPQRLIRVSAQIYNHREQYEGLARALVELRSRADPT